MRTLAMITLSGNSCNISYVTQENYFRRKETAEFFTIDFFSLFALKNFMHEKEFMLRQI
jgi:hypothetical protein